MPATLVALALLASAGPAEPVVAFVVVTRGEAIIHVGDPTVPIPDGSTVGYKHGFWGVFWFPMWTHSGSFCVYKGVHYRTITHSQAAALLGKSEADLGVPFFYTVPLGWLAIVPVVWLVFRARVKPKPPVLPAGDPRYRQPMGYLLTTQVELVAGSPASEDGSRYRAASEACVQHFVTNGVPREQAEANLSGVVLPAMQTPEPPGPPAQSPPESEDLPPGAPPRL